MAETHQKWRPKIQLVMSTERGKEEERKNLMIYKFPDSGHLISFILYEICQMARNFVQQFLVLKN